MRPGLGRSPMNLRGALPGLAVMALIAGAGVLFAFGVREVVPDDLLQGEPYGAVQVDDIELDPRTGLPIVPAGTLAEPRWWTTVAPNERIDASLRFASARPDGRVEAGGPAVTLMATFADHAAALEVAQLLEAAVGDPEAEAAWLAAAGVSPGDGFEWLGPDASRTPFVQVIDRRLLIDGLAWREAYDTLEEGPPDEDPPEVGLAYRSPLALALDASAVSVSAEGDRGGEGAIAFDLVCSGDADDLTTLEQDLADYLPHGSMRPPWIDPPLAADERKARRTTRLLTTLRAAPFVQELLRSDEIERLLSPVTEAATQALRRYLVALDADDLPELGHLADTLDREAMASALATLAGSEPAVAQAEPSGAPAQARKARDGGAVMQVASGDRRLWLQEGTWLGVAQGLGPMLDYLEANSCDDPWVVFHDFEQVRGD